MKKLISFVLSAVMVLSALSPVATAAYAEEAPLNETAIVNGTDEETKVGIPVQEAALTEEVPAEQETGPEEIATPEQAALPEEETDQPEDPSAVEKVVQLFAALPAADTVAAMTAEEQAAVMEAALEAMDAFDALTAEEADAFVAAYPELYQAVMEDLGQALTEASGNEASTLSVRPIPQTTGVYLTLTGYTKEELQAFPVDQIPTLLTDEKGEKIEVDADYTSAWFYFTAEDFDEYHTLNNGETVDLWYYLGTYGKSTEATISYTMYLVLGKGNQLSDEENHRYVTTVELNTRQEFYGYINPYLMENDRQISNGSRAYAIVKSSSIFDAVNMPGETIDYYYANYNADNQYKLYLHLSDYYGVGSTSMARNGIKLAVYPMSNFLAYRDHGAELTGEITEEIFSNAGYESDFKTPVTAENIAEAPNAWCLVFINQETQRVLGYMGLTFTMQEYEAPVYASLWYDKDGTMTKGFNYNISRAGAYTTIYSFLNLNDRENGCTTRKVETPSEGYPSYVYGGSTSAIPDAGERDFYFMLDGNIEQVKAVYEGAYGSEEAALNAGAKNITADVLYDGSQELPFGLRGNYAQRKSFTIVYKDGTGLICYYYVENYSSSGSSGSERDPYFYISSAEILEESIYGYTYNTTLSSYSAYSAGAVPLDTYYRRDDKYDVGGYQVLFIANEIEKEKLKDLIPVFWTPDGVEVNSGVKMESGETTLQEAQWSDAIADTVEYQVHVPGQKVKNYRVTFLTQQQEPTLFVAGPDERFVNLTADNNYVHDILIANVGKEDLTGLKVELIDPVHIKLDEYWTVGGAGNDTLPAFNSISSYYRDEEGQTTYEGGYATLANITKIRLLADGDGEISGTLRVTAANGQQRDIKLTGIAANPHITSAALGDAVKYVPYSYMIATDNMYNWNRTTFKIVDGKLPEGMKLYEATGEIYGVPQETGEFTVTVEADYSSSRFSPSTAEFTLTVKENTNLNVYNESDEGYSIQVPLGVEQGDETYDFLLSDTSTDQLYVSNGVFPEFVGLWLNGEKLVRGVDYTVVSGSTRITIKSQTFASKANQSDYNTIAAEFRVDGSTDNELKRTAQNFRLTDFVVTPDNSGGDTEGGADSDSSDDDNGGTSASSDEAAAALAAAQAAQATQAVQGVTLRIYLVDEADAPLPGLTVELHSTPRTGVTDEKGLVVFKSVEFGSHTLTVKDANGNVLATQAFELASGAAGITGNTITAMNGSALAITVKLANNSLSFARVTAISQTGDAFDPRAWVVLMILSGICLLGMAAYRKKKVQKKLEH